MNLQRKLTLVLTTGAVALGAGHFVQQRAADRAFADSDQVPSVVVSSVTPVAAGPSDVAPKPEDITAPVLPAEAAPFQKPPMPVTLAAVEPPAETPSAPPIQPQTAQPMPDCAIKLNLLPQAGAMVGVSLLAPCHAEQRVVLRHAGLAVTGQTSASGSLLASLPALTGVAEVEIGFADGTSETASVAIPDLTGLQRFVVQWQDADAFQLHAFENGAGYDQPGHISAAFTGTRGETGLLHLLGDASTQLPLLAEVYTFGPDADADVVLEAAVTPATCGRELLGEMLLAKNGSVEITDLTLAMPGCDALGDILVLKNIVQDMTLATAN